jgi:hypothetical protein
MEESISTSFFVQKRDAQTAAFLKEKGISPEKAGVHSGYDETSEMLVANPIWSKWSSRRRARWKRPSTAPKTYPDSRSILSFME